MDTPAGLQVTQYGIPAAKPLHNPSGVEQHLLDVINNARLNPDDYMARIGWPVGSTPSDADGNVGMLVSHMEPCTPLALHDVYLGCAQQWSRRMHDEGWYGHQDPAGNDLRWQLANLGYPWEAIGQCVQQWAKSPEETLQTWAADIGWSYAPHRDILFDLTKVWQIGGVGIVEATDGRGQITTLDVAYEYVPHLIGSAPYEPLWAVGLDGGNYVAGFPYTTGAINLKLNQPGKYLVCSKWEGQVIQVQSLGRNQYVTCTGANNHYCPTLDNHDFCASKYGLYLNRVMDPAGGNDWVSWLNNGTKDREQVMVGILSSTEFIDANNADYVNACYMKVLYRPIRDDERAGYAGKDYETIATMVVTSGEARAI